MKNLTTTLIVFVLVTSAIAAVGVITDFQAAAVDGQAVLDWKSGVETGVVSFDIQRSFDNQRFYTIASIDPVGNDHAYRYIDRDLFKDQVHTYYYRITVKMTSGLHQISETDRVVLTTSGIQQTWGSIKAMFR
ncbi:MAG: hypothetical protein HN356_03015 [Calditrichaeota bacterium]|jgi:hypothetical protein|nr:hypothetical protein [Calditrichota bacterium]MBT7616312.1 hypothetical protein [Calditrichota bacterium]MBT7787284.1 hypothetical protein [Calditrichota bacterium]